MLLVIATGYMFSRFNLLVSERFMPQVNVLVLMLCFPAFNLYLLGITLDLQLASAWK